MSPGKQVARSVLEAVGAAVDAVAKVITNPTSAGRYRPLYPLNLVDSWLAGNLEDAVRDRVVMVTGASSGIGAATARRIGTARGHVVLVARGVEKLEETAESVRAAGGVAHVYPCDLSDLDAIAAMADRVQADLGRVDILVNNAGRSIRRSLELSYDRMHDYQRTMQLNYFGPVRLMLKLLPGMRERKFGQVINVSSAGVQARPPRFGAYIASKAALDALCDTWQAETHADNVRFTTIHMALVRTPMIEATTIYDRFPTLTPEDAADVLCRAIVQRPRRSSPPMGTVAAFADAISPEIMDRVRSLAFHLFDDSAAAKGRMNEKEKVDEAVTAGGQIFAEIARGVHW